MSVLVSGWLHAFIATLIIETPIVVWLTRDVPMSAWRRTALAVLANLATHPVVSFVILPTLVAHANVGLVVAETWAVVIEWVFYFLTLPTMKLSRALGISALANGVSFALGLVLYQVGWL